MATIFGRLGDPEASNRRIADLWWVVALRGVGAIVLGLLAILWPGITLLILAGIFAAYCIVDAVFSIVLAVRGARRHERWGWSAVSALVALGAAAVTMFYPGLTMIAFVGVLAAWALITGVTSIAAAFRLERDHGRWWMIAGGVISIMLGVLLLIFPGIGLFTLASLIAFQSWLAGFTWLALAFRLRMRHAERLTRERSAQQRGPAATRA